MSDSAVSLMTQYLISHPFGNRPRCPVARSSQTHTPLTYSKESIRIDTSEETIGHVGTLPHSLIASA